MHARLDGFHPSGVYHAVVHQRGWRTGYGERLDVKRHGKELAVSCKDQTVVCDSSVGAVLQQESWPPCFRCNPDLGADNLRGREAEDGEQEAASIRQKVR